MKNIQALLVATIAAVLLVCATPAPAQYAGQTIMMSTTPFWRGGAVDPRFAGSYVFLDWHTGDLVVSYPADLGEPGAAPSDSPNVTFGVRLPNHVAPLVAVRIRRLSDGRFEYTYRVRNGPLAAAPITSWWLNVARVVELQVLAPPGWSGQTWVKFAMLANWRGEGGNTMADDGKLRVHFAWVPPGEPQPVTALAAVPPGGLAKGFTLISRLRPGLVRAYFQGGDIVRADDRPLPATVQAQLTKATRLEMASRSAITLGPKFSSYDNEEEVAIDYRLNIHRLTVNGRLLDAQSPFVQDALSAMAGVIQAALDSGLPPDQFVAPIPRVYHRPHGAVEGLVYLGLRLSMGVPPVERP